MTYKVVIEQAEEGGYTVYVPALKGCVSEGESEQEAIENIADAIKDYLLVLDEITSDKKTCYVEVAA
jgi:predicted RNase H-like HicB family nuclease